MTTKWARLLVLAAASATVLVLLPAAAQDSAAKPADRWTPEEQMKVRIVSSVTPSPDGRRVAFTVNGPVMTDEKSEFLTQIWVGAADGSASRQFTFGEKSSTNPQWSPDGQWVAFTSSRSGKNNIWRIRTDGGEAEQVTDVKTGVGSFAFSPDGRWIAYTMSDPPSDAEEKAKKRKDDPTLVDEDYKMSHLWVITFEADAAGKREPRQLTEGDFHVGGGFGGQAFDWSPDGKSIAFTHTPTPRVNDWTRGDISMVDVATGAVRPLAVTARAESSPVYSPDGRWIAYSASDEPVTWGFTRHVYVVEAAGGAPRRLAATHDEQGVPMGWTADGSAVYVSETHGTVTRIAALPVDGGAPRLLDAGDRVMGGINLNAAGTMFGFAAQRADEPQEAFATPADRWAPVQVSRANADAPKHPLGRTEVIRWLAPDGQQIEGVLTYPVGYRAGRRVPLLVVVHGGPAGVFTQNFIAARGVYPVAAFAAEGYAVLRPNVRGSSGYGREFRYANYKDWGGGDYRDIMSGVDHLIERGVADPERLGIMGWSYGGFMTSWVITQTQRFKAASVGAGVTNLMSFTGTADIPGFIPDYFGAEFWEDLEIYRAHSAMFHVQNARTPTLIQHGERDLRVPLSQGQELYNALQRRGVEVRMVVYPRQPHGITEPRLVLDAGRRNLEWFAKYVLGRE
jgi:dipeptidyl aminopeptidase/acylaminoacyl peptidase